ncbi:FtsX-like permease family protein [Arachidicoccus rhizosphaerae]|uniref:FtsX-like permease family protein n=1 Tax=Arachidicoccus rhizosphaerae TaxID=551991 RepID=A0A1H3ZMJ5_9BACT|nr:FtsX-like permease family protein [Arachidicoccus rhizosphaerae]SEA25009.1 FtsX-like permease family protein [Arachidicoccus rhizosphaerae]
MIKNYLKTAWRSLKRNKLFSGLNIFGLAIGMAGALLIAILLQHMLGYDRFHKDEDQLYVMANLDRVNGDMQAWKWTPKILGSTLADLRPEIEDWTRVSSGVSFLFTQGEHKIQNNEGSLVDSGFFKMFSFPLLSGSISDDWNNGTAIILSQSLAKSLYGTTDVVGQTIKLDTAQYLKIAAVIKDMPENTVLKSDYLLSWGYANRFGAVDSSWGNNSVETFIKLKKGASLSVFNNAVKNVTREHRPDWTITLFATPFKDNYLYNEQHNGHFDSGKIVVVRCLAIIGLLLLLIACINFMNLSTAQSERRAKEVGVKKVIGATKSKLITQFLVESVLLALLAFVIAVGIVLLVLPAFGNLVEMKLSWHFGWTGWVLAIGLMVVTGLLAGSYPAFYLSSFAPVKVLKGRLTKVRGKLSARSVLVVAQFTVAIILILSTIMITQDTRYVQNRDTGYDQNELLYSALNANLRKSYPVLRNELLQSGAVTSVSKNMSPITNRSSDSWGVSWPGSHNEIEKIDFERYSTDADMVKTMGMHLISGRDIDIYKYPADSSAMILTASAVSAMGLKNPIGVNVVDGDTKFTVVGVVSDFVIDQPFEKIKPMMIEGPYAHFNVVHYRLNPRHSIDDNLARIKTIFDKYSVDYPFEYHFADEVYAQKFKENKKLGQLSMLFAGLTIFISCLGLFGLITFMAETRTKEIGVRKVLGASALGIIGLLSKGFVKLILISFLMGAPLAYYIMRRWLSSSAYSVEIQWWWFLLTVMMAMVIAFITVSFQAMKAARVNPVQSLKTE